MRRVALYVLFALVAVASAVAVYVKTRGRTPTGPGSTQALALPSSSSSAAAPSELTVDVMKAVPRPFVSKLSAAGSLVSNEVVSLSAEVSRRLVKVHAKEGTRVKKGDVLFKLDDADLGASLRELTVKKKLAKVQAEREKKLAAEGLTSTANVEKAEADHDLLEAQVATLAVTIDKTTIRAPFDGLLGLRQVSEGAIVALGTPLITIEDDSRLKVDFSLPERYQDLVTQGQDVTFTIEGRADRYQAKVVAIEPSVDTITRSIKLRGVFSNDKHKLRAGSFVAVEVPIGSDAGALFVPTAAVIPSLGGHAVFVARDGKAAQIDVKIGVRTDTDVQIARGLTAGDLVITSQLLRVRNGMPIKMGKVTEPTEKITPPPPSAAPKGEGSAPP